MARRTTSGRRVGVALEQRRLAVVEQVAHELGEAVHLGAEQRRVLGELRCVVRTRISRASTVAEMLKRGLRTSWATPATSEPMASSVRARRSWFSRVMKAVTSRKVTTRQGDSASGRNHGLARR